MSRHKHVVFVGKHEKVAYNHFLNVHYHHPAMGMIKVQMHISLNSVSRHALFECKHNRVVCKQTLFRHKHDVFVCKHYVQGASLLCLPTNTERMFPLLNRLLPSLLSPLPELFNMVAPGFVLQTPCFWMHTGC